MPLLRQKKAMNGERADQGQEGEGEAMCPQRAVRKLHGKSLITHCSSQSHKMTDSSMRASSKKRIQSPAHFRKPPGLRSAPCTANAHQHSAFQQACWHVSTGGPWQSGLGNTIAVKLEYGNPGTCRHVVPVLQPNTKFWAYSQECCTCDYDIALGKVWDSPVLWPSLL